jgi:hypothetical protein
MSDDLLSTPLNKLPPPVVMSKSDGGGTISAPNYNDLRDSISIPTVDENRFQPPPHPQAPPPQYEPQQYYEPILPPPPPQPMYYAPPSIPEKKKKKRHPFFSTETLKDKKLWLFAVIVFLLYTYGLPKLHTSFPSFVDPATNTLKSPAIVAASIVSGLVYMFTSEFI